MHRTRTRDSSAWKNYVVTAAISGWALAATSTGHAQLVGRTEVLAGMVGQYAKNPSGLYGTDLGFSFKHGKHLWLMFGDSWKSATETHLVDERALLLAGDDALGFIDLTAPSFRDGDAMEAFARANRPMSALPWQVSQPIVHAVSANAAAPITLLREGVLPMPLWPGLTPVTGFSNNRIDSTAGAFGIFFRNEPLKCTEGCGEFTCDPGLGRCLMQGENGELEEEPSHVSSPCVVGQTPSHSRCVECRAVPDSGGLCVDTRSSMYDATPRGRASGVAMIQEVGCATGSNNLNRAEPSRVFDTRGWKSHRFFNAMARTVNNFDRSRANGAGNDYRTADGIDTAREGVFVWGRPHFGGWVEEGRDVQLYLAWVPMPSYRTDGRFSWAPEYFSGLDSQGRPQFTTRETDAAALPLNGSSDAGTSEEIDVVGQMSIAFISKLDRWVMIYGGGLSEQFGSLIFGEDWEAVKNEGTNAGPLYIRSAAQPWGPWTAPRKLLDPGDPEQATGLYGQNGILYSPKCTGSCVKSELVWDNPGGLYAPNIIEPWTEDRASSVDLYWNTSTWNPYEVVLMKTSLTQSDLQ